MSVTQQSVNINIYIGKVCITVRESNCLSQKAIEEVVTSLTSYKSKQLCPQVSYFEEFKENFSWLYFGGEKMLSLINLPAATSVR
jgi:hypothetical protein